MDKYLRAIRQNICSICADSNERGKCQLTDQEICAVEAYLPQIVNVVQSINSEDMNIYSEALRKTICINCRTADESGYCHLREEVNCSLDRYFPLIVTAIQSVDQSAEYN